MEANERDGQGYQLPERKPLQEPERTYTGPKNMGEVGSLLDGIEDLVHKGSLAQNYQQSGGQ